MASTIGWRYWLAVLTDEGWRLRSGSGFQWTSGWTVAQACPVCRDRNDGVPRSECQGTCGLHALIDDSDPYIPGLLQAARKQARNQARWWRIPVLVACGHVELVAIPHAHDHAVHRAVRGRPVAITLLDAGAFDEARGDLEAFYGAPVTDA
jgi:hypothetical protein